MCCTRLTEIQDAKMTQKSPSAHHRTTLSGYIFATKACMDNRKKNLLNSNMSSTCPHNMANFGPLTAETGWWIWGTQQISTGFTSCLCYCSDVAQRKSTKLCTMFGHLLGWYTIYTSCPLMKFCPVQNSLYIQVLYSPVLAALRHQPNFAAWYKEWNYWTFAEGATYIRRAAIMLCISPHSSFQYNLSRVLRTCSTVLGMMKFWPGRSWDLVLPAMTEHLHS